MTGVRWILLGLAGFGVAGCCGGYYPIEKDEPCRQVGYAIASRTHACTQDSNLANQRYRTYVNDFTCKAEVVTADSFLCSKAINELSCDDVRRWGDKLERWVGSSTACIAILSSSTRKIQPAGAGDLAKEPKCWESLQQLASRKSMCSGNPYEEELSWAILYMNGKYRCSEVFPSAFGPEYDVRECKKLIASIPCEDFTKETFSLGKFCDDYIFSPR